MPHHRRCRVWRRRWRRSGAFVCAECRRRDCHASAAHVAPRRALSAGAPPGETADGRGHGRGHGGCCRPSQPVSHGPGRHCEAIGRLRPITHRSRLAHPPAKRRCDRRARGGGGDGGGGGALGGWQDDVRGAPAGRRRTDDLPALSWGGAHSARTPRSCPARRHQPTISAAAPRRACCDGGGACRGDRGGARLV